MPVVHLFDPPERVILRQPLKGDAIARIEIPAIGVSEYVVEGTDTASLQKGPGHYTRSENADTRRVGDG